MKLYEINERIDRFFEDNVNPETGEVENLEVLEALQVERDQAIESIGLYIKNILAEAEAIKNEKQALESRQRRLRNRADSLKRYLTQMLRGEKFSTPRLDIRWRKSTEIVIAEGAEIPEEYLRIKEPEIDKIRLKIALMTGTEIAGVRIEEKTNIQIK